MNKYAYFKPIDYSYFKEMHDTDKYNEYIICLNEINLLNDRINKAIEYIEQQRDTKTHRLDIRLERVLKILQGVDKE